MRESKFTKSQIAGIPQEAEAGVATFYQWRSKYGGMSALDARRMRGLEQEDMRLKHMYADSSQGRAVVVKLSRTPG